MASSDPSLGPHSTSTVQGSRGGPYQQGTQGHHHGHDQHHHPAHHHHPHQHPHHQFYGAAPVSAAPQAQSMSMGGALQSPTAVLGEESGPPGPGVGPTGRLVSYGQSAGMLLGSASLAGGEAIAAHQHHLQQQRQTQPQVAAGAAAPHHAGPAAGSASSGVPKPIRRRMRMITSCLECRRRKLKCNKSAPCTNCLRFSRECMYLGPKLDEASQLRLTEIKEKVGSLERQLERDVVKSTSRGFYQQRIVADDVEDEYDEERDLEITPMVALDLTYDDPEADSTDDVIDLGIQVGRMRITERIGGLNRPRISEEIKAGLSGSRSGPGPQLPPPPAGFGPPGMSPPPMGAAGPPLPPSMGADNMSDAAGSDATIPDFLRPGASYIPPTSGFFFGQVVQSPGLANFLPSKQAGDRLIQRYFEAVHPIVCCVHRPSFEIQYRAFWDEVRANYEPRASVQAVVFAAWFSAAVSMDEASINHEFGFSKTSLMENMKIGTEAALSKANFLRTTRVETLQAFVMYMVPLCRAEVSRAHSVLVGAAVRMAECMGLHRDGDAYGLTPLETHMRRLIWHQLCFLDVRTCEAQGPKPAIRREDYDTKLPLNCEEDELTDAVVSPEPAECWTSTTLPRIRFEINEMMRIIWLDRRKLENRKTTLTAVLSKIENFRKRMHDKYDPFLDDGVPIQRYAKLVMNLLMYRLHAMVLHPYHSNTMNPMPQRLNSVLVFSGITIIEISIQLETSPIFAPWSWYLGAYQQFQIALLLATEIYYRPQNKEADRIWACLDYVFGMDRNTSRDDKGVLILQEIMGKTAVYMGMRKMRAPTGIAKAVPDKQAVKTEGGGAAAPGGSTSPLAGVPMGSMPPPRGGEQQQQQGGGQGLQLSPGYQPRHQQQMPSPTGLKAEPGIASGMMSPHPAAPSSGPGPGMGHMAMAASMQMQMPPPPPQQNFVFAGVSNGEVLWSLPPRNPDSPEASSDGGSVAGHSQRHGSAAGMAGGGGGALEQVDWSVYHDAINAIFPNDPHTGEFNMNGFADPNIGTKWNG